MTSFPAPGSIPIAKRRQMMSREVPGGNTPTLETERLVMRPLSADDVVSLHRISNEPNVRLYLWDDDPVSEATIEGLIAKSDRMFSEEKIGVFGIRMRAREDLLGFCGFVRLGALLRADRKGVGPRSSHRGSVGVRVLRLRGGGPGAGDRRRRRAQHCLGASDREARDEVPGQHQPSRPKRTLLRARQAGLLCSDGDGLTHE
jgi:hypothetical protein